MAWSSEQLMLASRQSSQDRSLEHPNPKRRRMSLVEVDQELQAAGLLQPALSLMTGSPTLCHGDANAMCLKRAQEPSSSSSTKRQRFIGGSIACPDQQLSIVPRKLLTPTPYSLHPPTGDYASVECTDISFDVHDRGIMMARLPPSRHLLINSNGCVTKASRLALDANGTAYFLSDEGEPLIMVMALPQRTKDATLEHEVKIKLLKNFGVKSICAADCEDACMVGEPSPWTPTTCVPSPYAEEVDDDMDCDDL